MNIVIQPYGSSRCYCRPDTTWERESKDFYSPESVNSLHWTPVVYVRISKAGKCISGKFVSRYYDGVGFGTLLYIGDFLPDLASASCADHTSVLPSPVGGQELLETADKSCEFFRNGERIFSHTTEGLREKVEEAICRASMLTTLRIGDFVAVELAPAAQICDRSEEETRIKAIFEENNLFDFKLIF